MEHNEMALECEECGFEIYLDCIQKLSKFPGYMRVSATNAIATSYLVEHCDDETRKIFAMKMIQDCAKILDEIEM